MTTIASNGTGRDEAIAPDRWILLDYSGTLSLEAPLFGQPDRLLEELKRSGLYRRGVDSLDIFWNRIVNPTWTKGSTTAAGYRNVIEEAVRTMDEESPSEGGEASLSFAVSSFAQTYFEHSSIDGRWQSHLQRWSRTPEAALAVVTDHYAEATPSIIGHLGKLGIEACPAGDATADSLSAGTVVVANSADLGVHKDRPLYWQKLGQRTGLNTARRIVLVDDFGANEQGADAYGASSQVEARRRTYREMLQGLFPAAIDIIPFIVEGMDRLPPEAYHRLFGQRISEAARAVDRFLSLRD
ncbi:MAG: hypothetical protein JW950_07435 [Deltaproteobacteria bacterium]|nr:hypothetical protein [Deltaproteobacteria bacterium]